LRNLSGTPVQLIGNGVVTDKHILQGIESPCQLKASWGQRAGPDLLEKCSLRTRLSGRPAGP
jgi:hypothetical protein